jgi:hypothetical protein
VDEAGRPTKPPVIVDDAGGGTATDGGTSGKTGADVGDGAVREDHSHVPFPADEIGRPGEGSRGYRSGPDTGLPSDSGVVGETAAGATAVGGTSAATSGGEGGTPGSGTGGGAADLLSGAAATLGDKLGSGREAVRQAVAATNSWLGSRVTRAEPALDAASDASRADATGHGSPAYAGAAARDSDVRDGSAARESAHSGSAPAGSAAAGRSLWRDTYAPQQSASRSASPWSQSYNAGSGAAPGVGPGASGLVAGGPAVNGPAAGMGGPAAATGTARSAAAAAGAGLAGYAGSVTAAWQKRPADSKRNRDSAKRNRRQAHLTLARVEPWSVMKFSFVLSVVAFIILFVAVAVLYMVLSTLGVFTSLQHTVTTITSSQGTAGTNISGWYSASRILGYTGMLGALNIVLITAMSTIGAVIYNLIAHTIGGIEVTFRETD